MRSSFATKIMFRHIIALFFYASLACCEKTSPSVGIIEQSFEIRPPLSPFPVPPMTPPAKSKFLPENFDRGTFSASRCTDAEIPGIIARVYRELGYVVDPHTACGFKELNPERVSLVLATASPAKFPGTIQAAIGIEPTHPSLEALKARPVVKHLLKATPAAITAFIERHAV